MSRAPRAGALRSPAPAGRAAGPALWVGALLGSALLGCAPPREASSPPPAAPPAAAIETPPVGPKPPVAEVAGVRARLEVGRCREGGSGVAARTGALGPRDAICVEVVGGGLAAAGQLRVRLDGFGEREVHETQTVRPAGDRSAPIRFEPSGEWPLGAYRLALTTGEQELATWDLEIRAGVTPADVAGE